VVVDDDEETACPSIGSTTWTGNGSSVSLIDEQVAARYGQNAWVKNTVRAPMGHVRATAPVRPAALVVSRSRMVCGFATSGAYRDRTGDLRLAKPALSQLS
jgi:hypothetical protein